MSGARSNFESGETASSTARALGRRAALALAAAVLAGPAVAAERSEPAKYPDPSLDGPPIAFFANLAAEEESALVESPAKGRADFVLDRKTLRFSWKITFAGLTSAATGAHIHGPQTPGGEAGALIDLAPGGVKSPIEGAVVLTDGQLRYLLTDRLYVNIATAKYKQGEIRGQMQRIRPKAPS